MIPQSQLSWLHSLFSDPFVSYEYQWATGTPRKHIEEDLDDAFDRIRDTEADPTWRHENRILPDDRIRIMDSGEIQVFRQDRWEARLIITALILSFPLFIGSFLAIGLFFLLGIYHIGGQFDQRPIPAATEIVAYRTNGAIGVLLILMTVNTAIILINSLNSPLTNILGIIGVGVITIHIYLDDGLPFISNDLAKRPMNIPFFFLINGFGATMLFFPTVLLAVFIHQTVNQVSSLVDGETTRATASVLSDMFGSQIGLGNPSLEKVQQVIIQGYTPILLLVFTTSVILLILWFSESKRNIKLYSNYQLQPFNSLSQRIFIFILFLIFTTIIYSLVIIATGILLYGVTGYYYPPSATLRPLVDIFSSSFVTSSEDILTGLYRTLDYVFADFPFVQARVWSITFLTVLLWPFVFATIGTTIELLARPYRSIRVLYSSTPASKEIQSMVDDSIQIRRINRDGDPNLRPLSVFFGFRRYIFVSDVVIDECKENNNNLDKNQLKGLLQHEQYHLRERSLGFGAIILSSVLGGANLLPAFYDFRKSERQADAYAAEVVGKTSLRHAIIRLYGLKARSDPNPIGLQHPGVVGADTVRNQFSEIETGLSNLPGNILTTLWSYLSASYQLYFGGILLDTAHMKQRDRLAALRDDDD